MLWRGTEQIPSGTCGISPFPGDTSQMKWICRPVPMLVVLFWYLPSNLWAGALPLSKQLEDNNAAQRTKLSFAQQVARTAEKPDLWRDLHSFSAWNCSIPTHQLCPSYALSQQRG